jgi:hypothetical protein
VYDHAVAAKIIIASDGVLRMVLLRTITTPPTVHGLGTIGPVKAFYAAPATPSTPPLRLWAFVLPTSGMAGGSTAGSSSGAGSSSSGAGSSSSGTASGGAGSIAAASTSTSTSVGSVSGATTLSLVNVSDSSRMLSSFLASPGGGRVAAELQLDLTSSLGVVVAHAVADGAWSAAAHAEQLRLCAAGVSVPTLVGMLSAVRKANVASLRRQRSERVGTMLVLGEVERLATMLETRAKTSLRRTAAAHRRRDQCGCPAIAT